jgi:IS30 family transposase
MVEVLERVPAVLPVPMVASRAFWAEVAAGRSSEAAARAVGVSGSLGARWFRERGGVLPRGGRAFEVRGRYVSFGEREEISVLVAEGLSDRVIAERLGRDRSTIWRERRRNQTTRRGEVAYRATDAQYLAERRARRPKRSKLATAARLRVYVEERLAGLVEHPDGSRKRGPNASWSGRNTPRRSDRRWASAWSPRQISERLVVDFPDDDAMRISHETIYQSLYIQGRGALKRELVSSLRSGRAMRVPQQRSRTTSTGHVRPEVMISERPASVEDRAIPGHWEGDLIFGSNRTVIGTLVERTTRYLILLHLPKPRAKDVRDAKTNAQRGGYTATGVRDAITRQMLTLPEHLRLSLTWDRGTELAEYAHLKLDTGLDIYFADPHSPWQRGTNENTNGLLRQYFPKGTNLARWNQHDLEAVAFTLNQRPRAALKYQTPLEAFTSLLESQSNPGVATTP